MENNANILISLRIRAPKTHVREIHSRTQLFLVTCKLPMQRHQFPSRRGEIHIQ